AEVDAVFGGHVARGEWCRRQIRPAEEPVGADRHRRDQNDRDADRRLAADSRRRILGQPHYLARQLAFCGCGFRHAESADGRAAALMADSYDFAILGANLLSALLAGLLTRDHGKRVVRIGRKGSAQRLPRGLDLALLVATRPATWRMLRDGDAETRALMAAIG